MQMMSLSLSLELKIQKQTEPLDLKRQPGMSQETSANQGGITKEVKIPNSLGLHARPAMQLVDIANRFKANLQIAKGSQLVDAKSIMQVMTLAATQGTRLTLSATGPDANQALNAMAELITEGFGEE